MNEWGKITLAWPASLLPHSFRPCGLGLDPRFAEEVRTKLVERVECRRSIGSTLMRDLALALTDRDLAVDLTHLARDGITEQILAELRDRLNRTRALAVGGAGGGTVVAVLVGHAIIIPKLEEDTSPLERKSFTIS